MKNYTQEVIDDVIAYNPAHARIPSEEIDKIADEVIKYERNCVSGISAALGAPGGVAMVATILADITQYYGYMLRATQKLMYLYGFPEIDTTEKGHKFDSETMNIGVIGGGITFITFKPCCDKLKASLQDTLLSNPNHHVTKDENIITIVANNII